MPDQALIISVCENSASLIGRVYSVHQHITKNHNYNHHRNIIFHTCLFKAIIEIIYSLIITSRGVLIFYTTITNCPTLLFLMYPKGWINDEITDIQRAKPEGHLEG